MIETLTQQLLRIAAEHGCEAREGSVSLIEIKIDWVEIQTRKEGSDWVACSSLRQLKLILGY